MLVDGDLGLRCPANKRIRQMGMYLPIYSPPWVAHGLPLPLLKNSHKRFTFGLITTHLQPFFSPFTAQLKITHIKPLKLIFYYVFDIFTARNIKKIMSVEKLNLMVDLVDFVLARLQMSKRAVYG